MAFALRLDAHGLLVDEIDVERAGALDPAGAISRGVEEKVLGELQATGVALDLRSDHEINQNVWAFQVADVFCCLLVMYQLVVCSLCSV